jgi:glutamate racemase
MTYGFPGNATTQQTGMDRRLPVGVFDSGVGGLTVLRALRERLPDERFLYLGDTARLPYGTKTGDSVLRYSIQAAEFLVQRGIKYLVIACNTASSVAVDALRQRFAPIPVIGVIEPGAAAGCASSRSGQIGVIATEGTVQGTAYQRAIATIRPEFTVVPNPVPCSCRSRKKGGRMDRSSKRSFIATSIRCSRRIRNSTRCFSAALTFHCC